jgi:hypothetical protein
VPSVPTGTGPPVVAIFVLKLCYSVDLSTKFLFSFAFAFFYISLAGRVAVGVASLEAKLSDRGFLTGASVLMGFGLRTVWFLQLFFEVD